MELCSWDLFYSWLAGFVNSINNQFQVCVDLLAKNPFNYLSGLTTNVVTVVQGVAISLLTLFFLMDFFKKSMDLQWVKWENVLMLLIKLIFAKVIIDNSLSILTFIFTVFNDLALQVTGATSNGSFLATGSEDIVAGNFLTSSEITYYRDDGGFLGLARSLKELELGIPLILIELILLVTEVVIFARIFEIMIYTMVAPIPLSSFASEEHRSIGIGFIKSYAAVALQGLILMAVFIVFTELSNMLNDFQDLGIASGSIGILFKAGALGISVIKSGSWAKKLCGAM